MGNPGIVRLAARPMFVALLATAALRAGAPAVTAWTGGRWFDGHQFRLVDVYSVGDRLTLRRPAAIDRTVDLAGRYVTGAFAEAHNHNIPSPDVAATIRGYLEQGIFYVMIQENVPQARALLGSRINVPTSVDVAFANGAFTAPGGHPTALVRRNIASGGMTVADLDGGFLLPVASSADIARAWTRSIRVQHPDFIKMMLVYSEDRVAGIPPPSDSDRYGLDPALVPEIVTRAHADGLRVSAHVESAYDFDVAVRAGVDIIAHMPGFWPDPARIAAKGVGIYEISDASAALAASRHVTVVTTVGEALRFAWASRDPGVRDALLGLYHHNFEVLMQHGVRIAVGSDQFRSTSLPEALDIARAGLMPLAALLRAFSTDGAATIFPARAPFGLAEGAPADFLVLDGNPLVDFTAVQHIARRVKAGRDLELP
jgi:hypothetical protein